MKSPSILIVACDPYLAGIYGRKFERDHWQVQICETLPEAMPQIALFRPDILLLSTDCTVDLPEEIKRLRALPALLEKPIVLLTKKISRSELHLAYKAGVATCLLLGHFVPQEAVEKMRALLKA